MPPSPESLQPALFLATSPAPQALLSSLDRARDYQLLPRKPCAPELWVVGVAACRLRKRANSRDTCEIDLPQRPAACPALERGNPRPRRPSSLPRRIRRRHPPHTQVCWRTAGARPRRGNGGDRSPAVLAHRSGRDHRPVHRRCRTGRDRFQRRCRCRPASCQGRQGKTHIRR